MIQDAELGVKWTRPQAFGEPVANEHGFVDSGVVDDDIDIEVAKDICLDGVEKLAKLLRPITVEAPTDDFADLDVQRGEQGSEPWRL